MDIETLAVVAGHSRWLEAALFETLGSWLGDTPEPAVREYFGVQCQRHAWHGELWAQRQPVRPDVDPETYVVARNEAASQFVVALRSATDTAERLAGFTRVVLARMIADADATLAGQDARTDAPTVRVLTLIRRDDVDAWEEGERLLLGLLADAEHIERVAAHTARLEVLAAEAAHGLA